MSNYRRGFYDGQLNTESLRSAGELGQAASRTLVGHRATSPCDACQLRAQLGNEQIAKDLARSVQMGLIAGIRAVAQSLPQDQRTVVNESVLAAFEPAFRRSASTHGVDGKHVDAHIHSIMERIRSLIAG